MKRAHFIAIGGSAMHNLAIALHQKGYLVSGSDDEIFEPSKSRLERWGLLPNQLGWDDNRISEDIDEVIVGMHARIDNPELKKAQELGLRIFSYPEYIFEQTKDKTRVVIGGSHGKTSITAMILHVLQQVGLAYDYMVGAQLEGFDCMVKLTENSNIAVLEGDEYLSSPIDRRPKFHLYRPNIALISGIAWDHINVFPTFSNYVEQFQLFRDKIEPNGVLIYFEGDAEVRKIGKDNEKRKDVKKIAYNLPDYKIVEGVTFVIYEREKYALEIFGEHNLQNIEGARLVCGELGVSGSEFYTAIQSFKGASKRLELVIKSKHFSMYKDFAHSPSKLKATTKAVKQQFPDRKLIACMELHTFSSLTKDFLNQYKGAMELADVAIVYYNEHTLAHKKLAYISPAEVQEAFGGDNIMVVTKSEELKSILQGRKWANTNLLMMSSGNFDGIDFSSLGKQLIHSV
jgi:UDP-N-acetylmuramate: L-alanyl-gamma-D-glutamyl-meso-diaminopimelate ligase